MRYVITFIKNDIPQQVIVDNVESISLYSDVKEVKIVNEEDIVIGYLDI